MNTLVPFSPTGVDVLLLLILGKQLFLDEAGISPNNHTISDFLKVFRLRG
jgi:hypothetical protein